MSIKLPESYIKFDMGFQVMLSLGDSVKVDQNEAELHFVEPNNFNEALINSWEKHYCEWPSRSYFVPPIFMRDVKETMERAGSSNVEILKESSIVEQLKGKQIEENMKERLFENFQRLSGELKEQLGIFVICNLKIEEMMASHLHDIIRGDFDIPQDISLDFIVFTNKYQILLIRFAAEDVEDGIRDLKEGCHFIKQRVQFPNSSTENIDISLLLITGKRVPQDENKINIFATVADLWAYIDKNIRLTLSNSTILDVRMLECLKTFAFIRATTCIRVSSNVRLLEAQSEISEHIMLGSVAESLEHARIADSPVYLKNANLHVRLRKNRLYNLTPQQLELLVSIRKTTLLIGAAGTGKTIITKLKLLEHMRNQQKLGQASDGPEKFGETAIFVPDNMIQEYMQFIEDNEPDIYENFKHKLHFYSISKDDYIENMRIALRTGASIFMDDSQHFYQFQRMFVLKDELNKWHIEFPDQVIWIVLDWLQFLIKRPLIVKSLIFPEWLFPNGAFYLDLVMRNTTQIIKLAAELQVALRVRFFSTGNPQNPETQGNIEKEAVEKESRTEQDAAGASTSTTVDIKEKLTEENLQEPSMVPQAALAGHKICGAQIEVLTWNNVGNSTDQLIQFSNRAVDAAIADLRGRNLLCRNKYAIIYSASWKDSKFDSGLGRCSLAQGLSKYYSFQISSQEFMTVIFVLYVPEEFKDSNEMQVTILSQIYQVITRAQTQLIIVADLMSIQLLKGVLTKFDEFVFERPVNVCFHLKLYFISKNQSCLSQR